MTTQPSRSTHDDIAAPFWQVQSVFDPDGTGGDFAYTIGLHSRGLPELHVWARPSWGDDPGHDWMLSNADRCFLLNELGRMLVAGVIGVGSKITREYDEGLARLTFRVDPPGDREELEAYGAAPGAVVLPVRWSLSREPEGPFLPLTAEAADRATQLYASITSGLDLDVRGPRGWPLPPEPLFDADQRFGPLTAVVLARAAQLWQADEETLARLLRTALIARAGVSLTVPTAMANALARPVGRRAAVEGLHAAAHDLLQHVTSCPAGRRRWRGAVRRLDPDVWRMLDVEQRERLRAGASDLLHDLAAGCLSMEAVADVAPERWLLHARGPWLAGLRGEDVLTDPAWRAAPEVLAAVTRLIAPLPTDALTRIAVAHEVGCGTGFDGSGYDELCARLTGWAMTSAASYPWPSVLAALPTLRALTAQQTPGGFGVGVELASLATCLASALTHRSRLSGDDVETLARPHAELLPGIAELLNAPL